MTTTTTPATATQCELFEETLSWQHVLVWREARYVPDAANELTVFVWELIAAGATDHREMYYSARNAIRRYRRVEQRSWRRPPPSAAGVSLDMAADFANDLVDELSTRAEWDELAVPDKARPWVEYRCGRRDAITPAEQTAGRRWAKRVAAQRQAVEVARAELTHAA